MFTTSESLHRISYPAVADTSAERDLQKVLQQLEPQISFLEDLTKMGGAMRTVLTKILTNQQTFKDLSMGTYLTFKPVIGSGYCTTVRVCVQQVLFNVHVMTGHYS